MYVRYNKNQIEDVNLSVPTPKDKLVKKKEKSKLEIIITLIIAFYGLDYMNAHPEIFEAHIGYVIAIFVGILVIERFFKWISD